MRCGPAVVLFAVLSVGCGRRAAVPGAPLADGGEADVAAAHAETDASLLELVFDSTPVGPERAVVLLPARATPSARLPVLVALHGRGESTKGAQAGAWAWVHDYGLDRTSRRLGEPPMSRGDFSGFVADDRLARVNSELAERPYRGLIVVCPWVPDLLEPGRASVDDARPFARFVVDQLLPRVVATTPALSDPVSTGIDGVSLGGRVALLVALSDPTRFGAVGTLQAAIRESEAVRLTELLVAARARAPSQKLRLLTSDADFFRGPILALHQTLLRAGVTHEHVVVVGPHDYPFNRGPGGIEMLLWHDRVLRGEAP
jgi:enterochelin esterase-like enzyme